MQPLIIESNKTYRDLRLVGDGTGVAIKFSKHCANAHLENILIQNFEDGVKFDDDNYGNRLIGVRVQGCVTGFSLTPEADCKEDGRCNANHLTACTAVNNKGDGFVLDGAQGNLFMGLWAEGNKGYGINIAPSGKKITSHNTFVGVWLERNKADIHWNGPTKANHTKFYGGIHDSALVLEGKGWLGLGNRLDIGVGVTEATTVTLWNRLKSALGKK